MEIEILKNETKLSWLPTSHEKREMEKITHKKNLMK